MVLLCWIGIDITCIMVTHDQQLKHYAHRVVHMMDGKVPRHHSTPIGSIDIVISSLLWSHA
jgi:ABC-type lipoprotein export system ATPase subunit